MRQGQANIQDLLGGLLKNRQLVSGMRRVMVMSMWEQVVGGLIAQKSWPEKMHEGVLTVGVSSHSWAQELHLLKPQILTRYRQLLGRSAIKDVEFRVARRRARRAADQHPNGQPIPPLHSKPGEIAHAAPVPEHVLSAVQNPEIRDLLGPVFARLRAEREWKEQQGWARCAICQRVYHGSHCPHCGPARKLD